MLGRFGGVRFAQYLLSKREHVQIQLRENRDVSQNGDPQEVVIGEGEVVEVWHLDAPDLARSRVVLGPVEAEQLACDPDRV